MSIGHIESDLLGEAVRGDRVALSELLLLHYDGLRGHVARRLSGQPEPLVMADDILHQTMVRAAQAISRYEPRPGNAFYAWLATIADNLIRDARRRQRRERRAGGGDGQGWVNSPNSSWAALVERLSANGTSPSVGTQRRDNARRVRAAVAALPADYREVIERHYLMEQSLDEIARAKGTTKGSIRAICYRARKRLRELMGRSSLYFSG